MKRKKNLYQLEKLLGLQGLKLKLLGNWLTKHLLFAIEHLPDKEDIIFKVFKHSVATIYLLNKHPNLQGKISSMLESLPKNKWTTFLDNLSFSNNLDMLHIQLLQILLQELTLKERVCQPFWKPACKDVSEMLSLPIGIDFAGLGSSLLKNWSQEQEVKSSSLTIQMTKLQNKSLQKIFCPSFMSSLVDKWEKDPMPIVKLKTLQVKIYPTIKQKAILNEFIDTSRFVYNRTLEFIKKGHKPNFQTLRDILVTNNTKKDLDDYHIFDDELNLLKQQKKQTISEEKKKCFDEKIKDVLKKRRDFMKQFNYSKNPLVHSFEIKTPKDIRANAVKRCCEAVKSGYSNLRNGNIKYFNMKYKKKTDCQHTIELTPKLISIQNGMVQIVPQILKDESKFKVSRNSHKNIKNLEVNHNVDIIRKRNEYFLHFAIPITYKTYERNGKIASGDLGVRTFCTVHSHNNQETIILEYKHRADLLKKYNEKINLLKELRKIRKGRIRKKCFHKQEKNITNLVNHLHWDFINHILLNNEVIYLGDIKSHDIVKGGKNTYLNVAFNNLRFFQLKQRLYYKASTCRRKVYFVPEHHTTKTCSSCGEINDHVGSSKVFECHYCRLQTDRDINAAKNIKLKGMFS